MSFLNSEFPIVENYVWCQNLKLHLKSICKYFQNFELIFAIYNAKLNKNYYKNTYN